MTKRASKSDLFKDQPNAEPSADELLDYQKVMREARDPKLSEETKHGLKEVIDRYAQQGRSFSEMKIKRWDHKVWWWRYVDSTESLTAPPTIVANQGGEFRVIAEPTAKGQEMMAGFNLTAAEIAMVKLDTPKAYRFPAFAYEMAVRLTKPDLIATPWIKLPIDDQLPFLNALMRPDFHSGAVMDGSPDEDSPSRWHWTRAVGNLSFNLLFNDQQLRETFFLSFIRAERRRLRIPSPTPNFGRQNKKIVFTPVEFFDLQRTGTGDLNGTQRKGLSDAKRKISKLLDISIPDARSHRRAIRRKV